MLVTRSRALISVVFLSTSLAVANPVGQGQATANPFLVPPAAAVPAMAPIGNPPSMAGGLSEGSAGVLQRYYPGNATGQGAGTAAGPTPAAALQATATATAPTPAQAVNPFTVPAVQPNAAETGAASVPFSMDGSQPAALQPDEQKAVVNEQALRYYAEQRNLERVGAEIRRLKALHPEWSPPADLFAPKSSVSEQPVWDLFALGRHTEAQQMLSALQQKDANYRPSADLTSKLADAFAKDAIKGKSDRGDWAGVLDVARERPSLLVCGEMDVLWRVGESFVKTNDLANGFELYRYILTQCPNPDERRATMQKAALLLPAQGVEALLSYGHSNPDGTNEFEGARFAAIRSAIADETTHPPRRSKIDANELAEFERFVGAEAEAEDANLLGWYRFNRGEFEDAKRWFDFAVDNGDDDKALEGVLLSLRNLDNLDEAEDLAYENADRSANFSKIYVELVSDRLNGLAEDESLEPADLNPFRRVVDDSRSALGAQTLGWYELARDEIDAASDWFDKSVDWEVSEEGILGQAVVASRTKDNATLASIKEAYGGRYAALSDIEEYRPPVQVARAETRPSKASSGSRSSKGSKSSRTVRRSGGGGADTLMQKANQLFENGQYQAALAALDSREARSGKTYGAEILRGWANFKLNRWNEAERVFRAQDGRRSTKETRSGIGAVQNSKYGMWPDQRNDCKVRWKC